jgi:D-galactarolactone cycloisomerase
MRVDAHPGGEAEFTRWGFRPILVDRAIEILQPDVCAGGGLSECKKIADMASAVGSVGWLEAAELRHRRIRARLIGGDACERQGRKFLSHFPDAEAPLRIVPLVRPVQHSQHPVYKQAA